MTLSEAYIELQKGNKITYPGLEGYVVLKDGKLVTELDFKAANERKDWKVTEDNKTQNKSKNKRVKVVYDMPELDFSNFSKYIDDCIKDFRKGFRF